jgi:hypothetical protein
VDLGAGHGPLARSSRATPTWAALAGIVALSALACAGCAPVSAGTGRQHPTMASGAGPSVTDALILDRARAPVGGGPIPGNLIIVNHSGRPITVLNAKGRHGGWVQVGLTNDRIPFNPPAAASSAPKITIPEGTNRIPVQVSTRYYECSEHGPGNDRDSPACLGAHHDVVPTLPAGEYRTAVVFTVTSPTIPTPRGIRVTLIAR